jgi:hypothetical protein
MSDELIPTEMFDEKKTERSFFRGLSPQVMLATVTLAFLLAVFVCLDWI